MAVLAGDGASRSCAASSTIRPPAGWTASPATPGLFSTAADLVALLPHAARRRTPRRGADPVAGDRRADDVAGDARRDAGRCAGWAGTSIRRTRRIAASCFRSDRSGTPASPAHRCGSIRDTKSYVIFLSNRVHPDGKGDVTALRGKVATVAAAALMTADRRRRDRRRVARAFQARDRRP